KTGQKTLGALASFGAKGKTSKQIAAKGGLSSRTYERAEVIIEQGPEELKEKLRKGDTSIFYAYKLVKRAQDHKVTPQLPLGTFDVILADPPPKTQRNQRVNTGRKGAEDKKKLAATGAAKELELEEPPKIALAADGESLEETTPSAK
ncbi:MAG: hypothetical protein ACREBU_20435, partial [Nitrososphaera sp.]